MSARFRAQALGLIVNEFITNSCKHAFPDGRGALRISLTWDGNRLRLELSDDGPGFEADPTKTLGLQIIGAMARSLDAELEWVVTNGTRLRLQMPAPRTEKPWRKAAMAPGCRGHPAIP